MTLLSRTISAIGTAALVIFLWGGAVGAQEFIQSPAEKCKATLLAQLDRQWKPRAEKAIRQYEFAQEARADYEKIRRDLLSDISYLGFIDPTGDFALAAALTFQSIKTKADLIGDLLEFVPAGKKVSFTKRAALELIQAYKRADEAAQKGVEYTAYKYLAEHWEKGGPIMKSYNAVENLAENVDTIVRLPDEHADFKDGMEKDLERLDRQIAKADARIAAALAERSEYDKVRAAILEACDDNPALLDGDAVATVPPEAKDDDQRQLEENGRMDEIVLRKRETDSIGIQDALVAAKQKNDASVIESGDTSDDNSSEALEFLGNFLGGFLSGMTGGGYSGGGSGGGNDCAQLAAQIQANRNWLAANGHLNAAAASQVRAALNQNIAIYNQRCT